MTRRRRGVTKIETYIAPNGEEIIVYFNKNDNRFEAKAGGNYFYNSDIVELKKAVKKATDDVVNLDWNLVMIFRSRDSLRIRLNFDTLYKAERVDGITIYRQALWEHGNPSKNLSEKKMPRMAAVTNSPPMRGEKEIKFTWEFLEAIVGLNKSLERLNQSAQTLTKIDDPEKLLDLLMKDEIKINTNVAIVTCEGGPEATKMIARLESDDE